MRVNNASSTASNSFCADGLISIEYLGTLSSALYSIRSVLFVRNPLFRAPRLGHQAVPKVLQNSTILLQIDLDGNLPALIVGDKVDSAHEFIVLQLKHVTGDASQ